MFSFDVIILGGGPGGTAAAKTLAKAGKKVALISDELGGECLNYGCIPTKTYLWTADLFEKLQDAENLGLSPGSLSLNWENMKKRRLEVVAKLKKGLRFTLEKAGVQIIEGRGALMDSHTVKITPLSPNNLISYNLQPAFIILATGSSAIMPPGFEKSENVMTNREILDLPVLPKTLLILGGGVIGCEFASLFAALGTQVTLAEAGPRLLPHEDAEISAELERVFVRKNITILKNTKIAPAQTTAYEKTLVAVGRKSNIAEIGLSAEELKAPHIFVIGDAAGRSMLAYTAEREGEIAAAQILGKTAPKIDYEKIPNTIFCLPEVASVGLTEEKTAGIPCVIGKSAFSTNAKALIMGSRDGFAKIIAEKSSGKILGIHIIGEKASELIAVASLALTKDLTLHDFHENLTSHPILGEVLKDACEAA